MPEDVSVSPVTLGGVPAEHHLPAGGDEGAAVVYLHGGGYCIGGADTHRSMCAHLAAALGCPVVPLDYRLAPEHPHPAAVDDATALGERLASAGVEVEVEVWPEMVHVWHVFAGRVPEADQGIAAVAAWLRHRLGLRDGTLAP